jgi:hypothetical protein
MNFVKKLWAGAGRVFPPLTNQTVDSGRLTVEDKAERSLWKVDFFILHPYIFHPCVSPPLPYHGLRELAPVFTPAS